MSEIIIPQNENKRPGGPKSLDAGNFFAPFFTFAIYRPSKTTGFVEDLRKPSGGAGAGDTETVVSNNTVTESLQKRETGLANIKVTSVSGQVTSFTPDSEISELKNFFSHLSIEMISSNVAKATVVLTAPYSEAIKIIDNRLIEFSSIMEIQWGYLNGAGGEPLLSDKGFFTIVQPSVAFGKEIVIRITGYDIFSKSAQSLTERKVWDRSKYPCDLSIIKAIVKDKAKGHRINAEGVKQDSTLRKRKPIAFEQTVDDWSQFRRILRSNNISFYTKEKTIFLQDDEYVDTKEPMFRLLWYKQIEDNRDIPMIDFESNAIPSLFAKQGSRGIKTLRHDTATDNVNVRSDVPENSGAFVGEKRSVAQENGFLKDVVSTAAGDFAPFSNPTAPKHDQGPVTAPKPLSAEEAASFVGGRIITQASNMVNADESARQEIRGVRYDANTQATATIPGHPALYPLVIVAVDGVGQLFGGNYRVIKVVHDLGRGGYTTKLELIRGASTGDKKAPVPATTGPDPGKQSLIGFAAILEDAEDETRRTEQARLKRAGCLDTIIE